jgi:hypothetical protein
MRAMIEWAEKEKVEITVDLITSNGDKDLLTLMAEGQARAGHDVMGLRVWYVSSQAHNFEPVDDVVPPLVEKYGKISRACEYLGRSIVTGWRCRPPTAAAHCRLAAESTASKNMSSSICRRCTR